MRHWVYVVIWMLAVGGIAAAQVENGLVVDDVRISTQLDAFGLETTIASGFLVNESDSAFTDITLLAEVYDADDELIGEGFGFLVTACGEALPPDFAMQPGMNESFTVPLDIFDPEAEIARVAIIPQVQATAAEAGAAFPSLVRGLSTIVRREVVTVEWIDETTLRYGVGCWRDLFTEQAWYEYNVRTGVRQAITHPRAAEITETLMSNINLSDPQLFARSFFTFGPGERRAVYQTDLHTLVTVEPGGDFPRVLYDRLYNISLQGIHFPLSSGGVFIAYYFGSYGDPVAYITANVNGQQLSQSPKDPADPVNINADLTSLITPGVSADGKRVIVMREVNGETAYYLRATDTDFIQLLFAAPPPGNNWPPPIYDITPAGERRVYVARPIEGEAWLQCYNLLSEELTDLTRLPLNLAPDARAWMWLAPGGGHIALASNGVDGGLWLLDLNALPGCD